jgi:tRNA threonylcarbamoyladenosine biosynthesis protein TsaE
MESNYELSQLSRVAQDVIDHSESKILLFYGPMGSGKTTLIKEIVAQLGVREVTSSPTFSLVNEYLTEAGDSIYHFDFYRIEHEEEAFDIGFEEYLESGSWCLIEWPENVENLLPLDSVVIKISINQDDSRKIQLTKNV